MSSHSLSLPAQRLSLQFAIIAALINRYNYKPSNKCRRKLYIISIYVRAQYTRCQRERKTVCNDQRGTKDRAGYQMEMVVSAYCLCSWNGPCLSTWEESLSRRWIPGPCTRTGCILWAWPSPEMMPRPHSVYNIVRHCALEASCALETRIAPLSH